MYCAVMHRVFASVALCPVFFCVSFRFRPSLLSDYFGRVGWVGIGFDPSLVRGEGCIHVMHDRSRMTIDPRIPTCRDGVRGVCTDQADIACNKREAP